jgi:hypothetical protein
MRTWRRFRSPPRGPHSLQHDGGASRGGIASKGVGTGAGAREPSR